MQTPHDFTYPYVPEDRLYEYVGAENPFILEAREYARQHSIDKTIQTGSVLVKDREIIGRGANGSDYHEHYECERVKQNIPTGQGYELCEGCHPKNHSEPRAIKDARDNGHDPEGADLYLWGHWWCCEPCWNAMQEAGINKVFLLKDSDILFNKEADDNIVGRQFDE